MGFASWGVRYENIVRIGRMKVVTSFEVAASIEVTASGIDHTGE
jgi:hypothetical protein